MAASQSLTGGRKKKGTRFQILEMRKKEGRKARQEKLPHVQLANVL